MYELKDYLNAIDVSKDSLLDTEDEMWEKRFAPFIVNKCVAPFEDTVMLVNEINQLPHLDKKLQNSYLLNTIRKKKRFSKWHKAEKSELLEIVMEFYGYSIKRAKEVLPLLTTEDIEQMKIVLDKGGMKGVK